jgi:hypothetical protein
MGALPPQSGDRKMKTRNCAIPECPHSGIAKVEDGKWLCSRHIIDRIHSPECMAMTQADEDMAEFREAGGKLS